MTNGKISATLTAEQKAQIRKNIEEIKTTLSFVIHLSSEERSSLPKMSDGSISFVLKALEYADKNPHLVPPYINVEELRKDFQLATDLKEIFQQVSQLDEMIEDTLMAAGSEAFQAALGFYASAKQASRAKVPGSDVIVEDLKKRFSHSSTTKKTPQPA